MRKYKAFKKMFDYFKEYSQVLRIKANIEKIKTVIILFTKKNIFLTFSRYFNLKQEFLVKNHKF